MAFPQSWKHSDHITISQNALGLAVTKINHVPTAVSLISDFCIPSKHIILSNGSGCEVPTERAPPLGIRIDSKSGVPNSSSKKLNVGNDGESTPIATGSPSVELSTDAFLDEVGVSRSSLKRLQVSAISGPIYYFEITPSSELTPTDKTHGVAIGLASVESVRTCGIDQCPLSIGFHSSGRFIHEELLNINNEIGFGRHDTVGCGLEIGGRGRVFFTCNGRVIGSTMFSGFGIQGESYYPAMMLQGFGTSVLTNFGASILQFRPEGLNICNYAFAFHKAALGGVDNSTGAAEPSAADIPIPAFDTNDTSDDDLDRETHPRKLSWGKKDVSAINAALQVLDQIIVAQTEEEEATIKAQDYAAQNANVDQALLDSYQDIFHMKIQRALSSGLKTISDLVQNDGLANEMQQRMGGFASPTGSSSSTPTSVHGEAKKLPRNSTKNKIEMVQMVIDSIRPTWQKMLDLINSSLNTVSYGEFGFLMFCLICFICVQASNPKLNLGALLSLNDRVTATVTQLEVLFSVTLQRAENKLMGVPSSPHRLRDRGNTEPLLESKDSIFSWPTKLSSSVHGPSNSADDNNALVDEQAGPAGFVHYSDFESLLSPVGSWTTPREAGFERQQMDSKLVRQITRTQVALPSLHELMTNLRRGSAEDVAKVADLIYNLFSDMGGYGHSKTSTEAHSVEQPKIYRVQVNLIKNIVEQGGLLVLLQALARCLEWPEVEIKVRLIDLYIR